MFDGRVLAPPKSHFDGRRRSKKMQANHVQIFSMDAQDEPEKQHKPNVRQRKLARQRAAGAAASEDTTAGSALPQLPGFPLPTPADMQNSILQAGGLTVFAPIERLD